MSSALSFVVNFVQDSLIMLGEIAYLILYGGGRSEGWKWSCHKLMLLDVSMYLVVWSNDSGINFKPHIQCLEDLFEADHELRHVQKIVF